MFVRRFTFTIVTFATFLFALYYQGMLFLQKNVSHETTTDIPKISASAARDGMIALSPMIDAPKVSVNKKIANHSRTLRAFYSENGAGDIGLYLESVNSPTCYLVSGGFLVTQEYPEISWSDNNTLEFYARVEEGFLVRIHFNIATMSAFFEEVDEPVMPSLDESVGDLDIE